MRLSPGDFAVISGAMRSAAGEMGEALMRAAHSTIVRESRDFCTSVLDANGDTVAQAEGTPIQMNSLSSALDWISDKYGLETVKPGDAFLLNNAYENGQHLNDIILILPIFDADDALIAFAGTIAHHLEVGGAMAGSNADATEIYQEGLILPSMRIDFEKDLYGGPIEQIITANVRCPDVVLGDLRAQMSSVLRGKARLLEILERYGREKFIRGMAELQDYSERRMRAVIARIPDGVYAGDDMLDGQRAGDPLVPMRAKITVRDDEVEVDLSECADQVVWPINIPLASSQSGTLTLFATLLGPEAITNAGTYRPIKIITRKGSIVDPIHPAPVRGRMTGVYRMATALKRALGVAVPDQTAAAGCDGTFSVTIAYKDGGQYNMFTEILAGGNGGAKGCDGAEAIPQILSNTGNAPVEAIERGHPFVRIREYSLIANSGGAGEFRGGLGIRKRFEILADEVLLSTNGDRHQSDPWGLAGGEPGSRTAYIIHRDGQEIRIDAASNQKLYKGDIFEMVISGGGGWGDPTSREPALIQQDIRNGRITIEAARKSYPHAFEPGVAAE
ncbi:MAG: hydantoinase B/oxoprolinase family protein [Alphaproteobacteria bacterium]|nr:hydantoinase B/oxoprolinase family protein [Alphaproteobacteria bacterium]